MTARLSTPVRLVLAVGLLVAVGVGAGRTVPELTGGPAPPGDDGTGQGAAAGAVGALTNPTGAATAEAGSASAQAVPRKVAPQHPDLVIEQVPASASLAAAAKVQGIDHVADGARFRGVLRVTTRRPGPAAEREGTRPRRADRSRGGRSGGAQQPRDVPLEVLAVRPGQFRPLTPEVTAQNRGVWQRMSEGDVVVRHDVAQRLGLRLGDTYRLRGPGGAQQVRVGAFASNGAPPFAELLVPWSVAQSLGVTAADTVVAAVGSDHGTRSAGEAMVQALGGGELSMRYLPRSQLAELDGSALSHVPAFSYRDRGDGTIEIDAGWVQEWIVTVDLPYLGTARCNKVMVPQLLAVLQEIEAAGLADQLRPDQFGGCWSPRHVLFDPGRSLSMHAWGLAVDINTATNGYGAAPQMDPRIVALFERWGFEWGGHWSTPDGMHFELERIVRPN